MKTPVPVPPPAELTQEPAPPVATSTNVLPGNLGVTVPTIPNPITTGYLVPSIATYASAAPTVGNTMPGRTLASAMCCFYYIGYQLNSSKNQCWKMFDRFFVLQSAERKTETVDSVAKTDT